MKPGIYHVIRWLERKYQNPAFLHGSSYHGPDRVWELNRIN